MRFLRPPQKECRRPAPPRVAKAKLANEDWPDMDAYVRAKTERVEQITARALQEVANVA
jgi:hypothetical protein